MAKSNLLILFLLLTTIDGINGWWWTSSDDSLEIVNNTAKLSDEQVDKDPPPTNSQDEVNDTKKEDSWFGKFWKSFEIETVERNPAPHNTPDYPNGFWIGKQQLFCVIGIDFLRRYQESSDSDESNRSRRSIRFQRRNPFESVHRILYYKGLMYEWGTGHSSFFTYHVGPDFANNHCDAYWEEMPIGESNCSTEQVMNFTINYSKIFEPYHLVTNNCHHYVNRLMQLLLTPSCTVTPESENEAFGNNGFGQNEVKESRYKHEKIRKESNKRQQVKTDKDENNPRRENVEVELTGEIKDCEDKSMNCGRHVSRCSNYDESWTDWMTQNCASTCGLTC